MRHQITFRKPGDLHVKIALVYSIHLHFLFHPINREIPEADKCHKDEVNKSNGFPKVACALFDVHPHQQSIPKARKQHGLPAEITQRLDPAQVHR